MDISYLGWDIYPHLQPIISYENPHYDNIRDLLCQHVYNLISTI